MELDNSKQYSIDQLQNQKFDVFITVSGYESRSIHLATLLKSNIFTYKLALAFNEKKNLLYREINDAKFKELGFEFKEVSSSDATPLNPLLNSLCEKLGKSSIDILIDYSSMPKIWYSEIINYFNSKEDDLGCVNLWFCYTPSEYTRPIGSISNKYLDPVKPIVTSDKPIALIMGLGYEKGRAEELAKLFKSQITFAFYANPSSDDRYVQEVLDNNKSVLKNIKQEQIIPYPINDLNSINDALTQLCIGLRMNHQVLLVPVGPKPFTLMCSILSVRYPDIKTCRVSSVISSVTSDRRPFGDVLIYKVTFTNEEVDY
jgi:hypothetical protein